MQRFKGTVKNGKIVLKGAVRLPEGAQVDVRVTTGHKKTRNDALKKRREIVQRILDHQIEGPIGMAEIIEEDKREREERWDYLFGDSHDADPQEPSADR